MTRWEPAGRERLQRAAVELFLERGYGVVTVAEIAERAGLTKRSFFNHFADKSEVLFAGAGELQAEVIRCLREVDATVSAFDAGVDALGRAGRTLAEFAPHILVRREMIKSSSELQERDLMKSASLAAAVAEELVARGSNPRAAHLAAGAAVAAFSTAYDDWGHTPNADFGELMSTVAAEVRAAVS